MSHIDFNHHRGSVIADEILSNLEDERQLQIIKYLGPKLGKDGNQWIYLLGEMPTHYLAGWGDTPYKAMEDFIKNFYNQKIERPADQPDTPAETTDRLDQAGEGAVCPQCRHQSHEPGECFNMASDNNCDCEHKQADNAEGEDAIRGS